MRPSVNHRALRLEEDKLNPLQKRYIEDFSKRYSEKFKNSKLWVEKNRFVYCDWMNALTFKKSLKELIFPIFSDNSKGAYFTDIDGNKMLDIAMGYGVNLFGHNPDFIKNAVAERLEKGYELGPQLKMSAEVAGLISELTGVERVAFCNSGTEAVMTAIRVARAKTSKNKIVMFSGSYHGTFDSVVAYSYEGDTYPISTGTPEHLVKDTYVLTYNTQESLEFIKNHAHEIGAVICEPVQSRNPGLRAGKFLQELRDITLNSDIALLFDETINGFRIHSGGAQAFFSVKADLVVYGKAIGGGLPISAVAGRSEYMDFLDGGMWKFGDGSTPKSDVIFHAGTYYKHPLSLAAAKATLMEIKMKGVTLYKKLQNQMDFLANELNGYFDKFNVPLRLDYCGSMFRFMGLSNFELSKEPVEIDLLFKILIYKGLYTWEKRTCFISDAHTKNDINLLISVMKDGVQELRSVFEFFRV